MAIISKEILKELSDRISAYRIEYPMTQKELANKSGVSLRTIQMFEHGNDIQLSNLIKILTALGLADNLSVLVPDVTKRPSMYVDKATVRRRARSKKEPNYGGFKWGDEA